MASLSKVFISLLLCFMLNIWQAEGQCNAVHLVSRSQWGARPARGAQYLQRHLPEVFIHHSAGGRCYSNEHCVNTVRAIQRYHMEHNGWNDIGYNFLVGDNGRVYEGRGWGKAGAHARGYNFKSYGICFLGNFMNQQPSWAALNAAKALIQCGVEKGYISSGYNLFGHRDGGSTLCPGDRLYGIIQSWPHYSHRHP